SRQGCGAAKGNGRGVACKPMTRNCAVRPEGADTCIDPLKVDCANRVSVVHGWRNDWIVSPKTGTTCRMALLATVREVTAVWVVRRTGNGVGPSVKVPSGTLAPGAELANSILPSLPTSTCTETCAPGSPRTVQTSASRTCVATGAANEQRTSVG